MPGNLKKKKNYGILDKRSFRKGQTGYDCYEEGKLGTLSREE